MTQEKMIAQIVEQMGGEEYARKLYNFPGYDDDRFNDALNDANTALGTWEREDAEEVLKKLRDFLAQ